MMAVVVTRRAALRAALLTLLAVLLAALLHCLRKYWPAVVLSLKF